MASIDPEKFCISPLNVSLKIPRKKQRAVDHSPEVKKIIEENK
jgi:hypothetical protein